MGSQTNDEENRHVTDLLHDQKTLWQILFEQSIDGIVVFDQTGKVFRANKKFADMLGYSMEEVHQLHVWDWDSQMSEAALLEMIHQIDFDGDHFETRHRRKSGDVIDVELSNSSTVFDGQKLIFCICRDITQRKLSEERIYLLATTDSLTNMTNRREFSRILQHEIDRAKRYDTPLSLIMYDIDHFKKTNDTFGHDVGDEVLVAISRLVRENIRSVDVAARWGGEEFMVLMTQCDRSAAGIVAEKLRQAIAMHRFDAVGHITASFGVTVLTTQDDFGSLVKRVDAALYKAKSEGRNRVEIL